ncbi:MAG: O-antigen ligase family protein [Fuerstiella sp.]
MLHLSHPESDSNRLSRGLLWLVDLLIAGLILVLPFIMGGREAWGHWFLISAALLLGAAWAAYAMVQGCRYQISWLELFLVIGLAIAWFQTQPQPAPVMSRFSAEYDRLLPTWAGTQPEAVGPRWSTLSLTPVETRHAWWVFLAYAVIVTVLFQRLRQPADCYRLLKGVGIVGVLMTSFALLQWATSNDRFFWFYKHPFTDTTVHLKGAFTNRNHFAQFLSLTIGPLLWWLFHDVRRFLQGDTTDGSRARTGRTGSASSESGRSGSGSRRRSKGRSRGRSGSSRPATAAAWSGFQQGLSVPILMLLCGVSVVIVAVLLSLSRGGMIAAGAVTMIALVGLWRGFRLGGAMAGILLGGGFLFLGLLAFSDQEQLQTKLDQLVSGDADQIDTGGNRRAVWAADAKVIRQFPLLGTGVGSHRDVYTLYMDNYADFAMAEMTHAESSFVHAALETGLVGAGCLVAALLCLLGRLVIGMFRVRDDAGRACVIAVLACTVGAVLHAVVDFIWYVPAIVVTSLTLAVVGLKSASVSFSAGPDVPDRPSGIWFPRPVWAVLGGLCLLGLIQIQPELVARISGERHLHAALRTKLDVPPDQSDGFADLQAGEAISLDEEEPARLSQQAEAEYEMKALVRRQAAMVRYLGQRIQHLNASLQARPDQHRVRLMLAEHLIRLFDLLQMKSDNPMPLNMIRDAALASGFESSQEVQAWVRKACGSKTELVLLADRLARASLRDCPVQGHAYLSLVETQFLNDPRDTLHQPLIDQAMLVRGHDPRVRFVAGREAIMSGDQQTAMQLWQSVFHSTQHFRLNILQLIAAQVPVEFFLHQFQPNAEELKDLLNVYDALGRERDIEVVLRSLCAAIPAEAHTIEDEEERLQDMMLAYSAARRLNDLDLAISILHTTATDFPLAFEPRYHLGMTLVELERPKDAMPHLQWCHEQDPGNIWIPKLIVRARRQMLKIPEEGSPRLTQL